MPSHLIRDGFQVVAKDFALPEQSTIGFLLQFTGNVLGNWTKRCAP